MRSCSHLFVSFIDSEGTNKREKQNSRKYQMSLNSELKIKFNINDKKSISSILNSSVSTGDSSAMDIFCVSVLHIDIATI